MRVPPPAVVLANVAVGLAAACALGSGELVAAALLLQLKTLLDNADGLLARASGRVTLLGRYLDTEADLVVNVAVFVALGSATGSRGSRSRASAQPRSCSASTSTWRAPARGARATDRVSGACRGQVERALERVYRILFAPQDRAIRALSRRRLDRALAGEEDPSVGARATLAYHDRLTLGFLANTGLSTQLAVLGLCLVAGAPVVYLWLLVACAAPLPLLQLRRERLARRALRSAA